MGLMAGPALIKKGYQKELTSGIICASGTLGILIPPSIMLVVYGGLTGYKETSIGNLFAGAILPGILLATLYFLYITILCYFKPKIGPPISESDSTYSATQKWTMTLKSLVPPLGLILTVMGTILSGIATPTEAAALGVVGAMALALANRQLNWRVLKEASLSTYRTTAMIMMLFIGGKFFSTVFLSMGGGDVVANFLLGGGLNRYVVLAIMMAIVFYGNVHRLGRYSFGNRPYFHPDRHGA